MLRKIFMTAILTGLFCSGFAITLDFLTDMLERTNIILASFASGFFGSLFAQTVLGRWIESRKQAAQGGEQ
ncbi:MAG: hypothetical protein ACR2O1_14505 [Boseongicola sp.]